VESYRIDVNAPIAITLSFLAVTLTAAFRQWWVGCAKEQFRQAVLREIPDTGGHFGWWDELDHERVTAIQRRVEKQHGVRIRDSEISFPSGASMRIRESKDKGRSITYALGACPPRTGLAGTAPSDGNHAMTEQRLVALGDLLEKGAIDKPEYDMIRERILEDI
jgi:hypothetical protein